jgi:hypothetical protein
MTKTMSNQSTANALLIAIGVVLSLSIFVGTFFTYFSRHQAHIAGSYVPIGIGTFAFLGLMTWINYFALTRHPQGIFLAKLIAISFVETTVFVFLLLFLLLNTIGS